MFENVQAEEDLWSLNSTTQYDGERTADDDADVASPLKRQRRDSSAHSTTTAVLAAASDAANEDDEHDANAAASAAASSASVASSGLPLFLAKCQGFWNSEIKKAEARILRQICGRMAGDDAEAPCQGKMCRLTDRELSYRDALRRLRAKDAEIEDLRAKLDQQNTPCERESCRQMERDMKYLEALTNLNAKEALVEELRAKLQKENLSTIVPLAISPDNEIVFDATSSATVGVTLRNPSEVRMGWKVYVSMELIGCLTFAPNDGVLAANGGSGRMVVTWNGKEPKRAGTSTAPLSFTIKWTAADGAKFRDEWLMQRPIRQHAVVVDIVESK